MGFSTSHMTCHLPEAQNRTPEGEVTPPPPAWVAALNVARSWGDPGFLPELAVSVGTENRVTEQIPSQGLRLWYLS